MEDNFEEEQQHENKFLIEQTSDFYEKEDIQNSKDKSPIIEGSGEELVERQRLASLQKEELYNKAYNLLREGRRAEAVHLCMKCLYDLDVDNIFPSLPKCLRMLANYFLEEKEYVKSIHFVQAERLYYESALLDAATLQQRLTELSSSSSSSRKLSISPDNHIWSNSFQHLLQPEEHTTILNNVTSTSDALPMAVPQIPFSRESQESRIKEFEQLMKLSKQKNNTEEEIYYGEKILKDMTHLYGKDNSKTKEVQTRLDCLKRKDSLEVPSVGVLQKNEMVEEESSHGIAKWKISGPKGILVGMTKLPQETSLATTRRNKSIMSFFNTSRNVNNTTIFKTFFKFGYTTVFGWLLSRIILITFLLVLSCFIYWLIMWKGTSIFWSDSAISDMDGGIVATIQDGIAQTVWNVRRTFNWLRGNNKAERMSRNSGNNKNMWLI